MEVSPVWSPNLEERGCVVIFLQGAGETLERKQPRPPHDSVSLGAQLRGLGEVKGGRLSHVLWDGRFNQEFLLPVQGRQH